MTSNVWSQVDSNGLTIPNASSTPDLFGGDLFGDELMDMYNSDAVVGGSGEDAGEIPTLLLPSADSDHATDKVDIHHSAQITMMAAADDGLGAFRPSTSFNDFSTLLNSSPAVAESNKRIMSSANTPTQLSKQETGRKRAADEGQKSGLPARKRSSNCKTSSPLRKSTKSFKPGPVISGNVSIGSPCTGKPTLKLKEQQSIVHDHNGKANTPNPLSMTLPGARPLVKRLSPVKTGMVGAAPAVVSPRTIPSVSNDDKLLAEAVSAVVSSATAIASGPPEIPVTETDFSSVAQAAVTNLILNAGANSTNSTTEAPSKTDASKGLDLSTAHIKALTSANWVTNGSDSACPGVPDTSSDSKANRARRQSLNPDERARQNRDRNREHARNTRLRKKAYVEELKRTLTELVSQRDSDEIERRQSLQRELEQREVRFRVMEEFLKLRGRNEPHCARWIAILEEGFSLTLPFTAFREMAESKSHVTRSARVFEQSLRGAAEVMADSNSLSAFLQTLGGENSCRASSTPVALFYQCDRKNFFMDGCTTVLTWSATSVGAVRNGSPYELSLKGNMLAKFSPASNKLISADIQFDTGCVIDQLQDLIVPKFDDANMETDGYDCVAAAAQAAAYEADALLDSLQVPQLGVAIPSAVTIASESTSTAASVTSSDKSDCSSDESMEDGKQVAGGNQGILTRRNQRH